MSAQTKGHLRQRLRRARRNLGGTARRLAALRATRRVAALPEFRRAQQLALFLSADSEMDTAPLLRLCTQQGKRIYLPILRGDGNRLAFAPYTPGQRLRRNRYGIAEPVTAGPGLAPQRLDLALLPLVGFDSGGQRLGMGGGYYDRTFAFVRRHWRGRRPRLVGLAHEIQRAPDIPTEPWDIVMDAVVTDTRVYRRSRKSRRGLNKQP